MSVLFRSCYLRKRGAARNMIAPALLLLMLFATASGAVAAPGSPSSAMQQNPEYWIGALAKPDEVVLAYDGIAALNKLILSRVDQMAEIADLPDSISGEELRDWLVYDPVPDLGSVERYDGRGRRLGSGFAEKLAASINLEAVSDVNPVRFGRVAARADIRGFPTDGHILRAPGKAVFDTLQYSSIYPLSPVALLHTSKDGKWGFFQTPFVRGWMRLDKVAFGNRDDAAALSGEPLVILGSKVALYLDESLKRRRAWLPMGTGLDIVGEDALSWRVRAPVRGSDGALEWTEAYVSKKADAQRGFLPYTPRSIIRQAFKMLGERYGWGGREGRRDCSGFIKDVFATVGVRLPRNSQQQALAGVVTPDEGAALTPDLLDALISQTAAATETKAGTDAEAGVKAVAEIEAKTGAGAVANIGAKTGARAGITFLVTPVHIMLYIGSDGAGTPFVIHQTHGYTENGKKRVVDKVVVSGLGYKEGKAGLWPLLGQVKSVTGVRLPVAPIGTIAPIAPSVVEAVTPVKAVAAVDGGRAGCDVFIIH